MEAHWSAEGIIRLLDPREDYQPQNKALTQNNVKHREGHGTEWEPPAPAMPNAHGLHVHKL